MGLARPILSMMAQKIEERIMDGYMCRHMGKGAYYRLGQLKRLVTQHQAAEHEALADARRTLAAVEPFEQLPEPRAWEAEPDTRRERDYGFRSTGT